jgi:uncharacterized membrane protein (DUF106 family)
MSSDPSEGEAVNPELVEALRQLRKALKYAEEHPDKYKTFFEKCQEKVKEVKEKQESLAGEYFKEMMTKRPIWLPEIKRLIWQAAENGECSVEYRCEDLPEKYKILPYDMFQRVLVEDTKLYGFKFVCVSVCSPLIIKISWMG